MFGRECSTPSDFSFDTKQGKFSPLLRVPKCYPHDSSFYILLSIGIDGAFGQRVDIFLTDGDNHGNSKSEWPNYPLITLELVNPKEIYRFFIMTPQQHLGLQ